MSFFGQFVLVGCTSLAKGQANVWVGKPKNDIVANIFHHHFLCVVTAKSVVVAISSSTHTPLNSTFIMAKILCTLQHHAPCLCCIQIISQSSELAINATLLQYYQKGPFALVAFKQQHNSNMKNNNFNNALCVCKWSKADFDSFEYLCIMLKGTPKPTGL